MLTLDSSKIFLPKRLWTIAMGVLRRLGWGILAIIILLVSWYLIRSIVLVSTEEISQDSVLVFAVAMKNDDITDHKPHLLIKKENDTFEALIVVQSKSDSQPIIVISNLLHERSCSASTISDGHIELAIAPNFATVEFNANDPNDKRKIWITEIQPYLTKGAILSEDNPVRAAYITCKLALKPFIKTFTDRRIRISPMFIPIESGSPFAQIGYNVNVASLTNESNFRITGGELNDTSVPDEERSLLAGPNVVTVFWKDEELSEYRDILLVLIGSLIGLAAACVLEWIRPLITREKI